jgi:hypothetical protein
MASVSSDDEDEDAGGDATGIETGTTMKESIDGSERKLKKKPKGFGFRIYFSFGHSGSYTTLSVLSNLKSWSFCSSGSIRATWPATSDTRRRKITQNSWVQSEAESSICANLDEVMLLP